MSDVLTISSVLKGVSPLITVAGLQTILAKRGLTGDEEYAALSEKDRDLAEGTAYYWLSNLPTSGGTSKVQDGGWAKSEGGWQVSSANIAEWKAKYNALFDKWNEPRLTSGIRLINF